MFVVPVSKVAKASKTAKATKAMNKTKAVGKFKKGTSVSKIKEKFNKVFGKTISAADRAKINKWKITPSDALYLKYKKVYDNSKFFNQKTGEVIYPGTKGDINKFGFVKGKYKIKTLKKGEIIDRYGSEGGKFFSPVGSSYESRALPPFMESEKLRKYKVLKPLTVKSGKIAPWFGKKGKGTQYLTDKSVKDLIDEGFLIEIK